MTSESNDIVILIVLLGWITIGGYSIYQFWFKAEVSRDAYRKGLLKAPEWYPFRNFGLWFIETPLWIWFNRILSVFIFFVGMGGLIYWFVK